MSYVLKMMVSFLGLVVFWGLGFIIFYAYINHLSPISLSEKADAIVVFTGGRGRIQTGLRLLRMDLGKALLISGVTSEKESLFSLKASSSGEPSLKWAPLNVTLGYAARDTIGNVRETADWVFRNRYNALFIVTSDYHLPRSLMELRAVLPHVKWLFYPVFDDSKDRNQLIFQEYNKFIYSFVRLKMEFLEKKFLKK